MRFKMKDWGRQKENKKFCVFRGSDLSLILQATNLLESNGVT